MPFKGCLCREIPGAHFTIPFLLRWLKIDCKLAIYTSFKGGGGGVHPDYFVKLDFEIAVDQQTRARDRTFEGVPDSG